MVGSRDYNQGVELMTTGGGAYDHRGGVEKQVGY